MAPRARPKSSGPYARRIDDPGDPPGGPLPPRYPQPWYVHWAVCTLAAFLVILPFSLRNLPVGFGIAVLIGACLMPVTQRVERRHLAEREPPA